VRAEVAADHDRARDDGPPRSRRAARRARSGRADRR
jgi:hypothetical protein